MQNYKQRLPRKYLLQLSVAMQNNAECSYLTGRKHDYMGRVRSVHYTMPTYDKILTLFLIFKFNFVFCLMLESLE